MKPYIIWKGKLSKRSQVYKEVENPSRYNYPNSLAYYLQENAWMDETSMLQWILQVWNPIATNQNGVKILLLDEVTAHMTTLVRQAFAVTNTIVEYIPGGYTSKLQTMDVGINKPFKDHVRDCVDGFIFDNKDKIRPQRQDVTKWVEFAWNKIRTETLLKTWRQIGYTQEDTQETDQSDETDSTDCLALQEPIMEDEDDYLTDTDDQTTGSDSF